ncbi:hypothetical protein [Azospirillum rugosum]|uniref:Uncharacterized protein n=1 Tax=Azospirillum rugosum TaxID=416170 RepID=A0ABS4SNX2_9PROT|nr:hypothetical protein [Azospirillum rugosum]MBP2294258.1 hypothetical protein [Azospirillum rugosum]MDQ0527593.1 hypothetical protein [Azospirillum rugosum]
MTSCTLRTLSRRRSVQVRCPKRFEWRRFEGNSEEFGIGRIRNIRRPVVKLKPNAGNRGRRGHQELRLANVPDAKTLLWRFVLSVDGRLCGW